MSPVSTGHRVRRRTLAAAGCLSIIAILVFPAVSTAWTAAATLEQDISGTPQATPPQAVGVPPPAPQAPGAPGGQKPPGQSATPDTPPTLPPVNIDVVVSAPRMDIPLKSTPAATSIVTDETFKAMPRGIGADEAFMLVPGMKVDNQADGERVHVSIRGQGLLTERGIRGIKVLLDGLPLNDPTGFAPDLFDVDWSTVRRVEVFRGPSSALYGGGAAGGVINITTRDGGSDKAEGLGSLTGGSYGFWKGLGEVGGTSGSLNYRVSLSHNAGDGYRVHTAFDATNVYGKFRWDASPALHLTAIVAGTSFFNENAEGLNLTWLREDRRQPNPDALTFNEYQKTRRATTGLSGQWAIAANQDLMFSAYLRHTTWTESVPSSVQHRIYNTPGAILQYSVHTRGRRSSNHFTVGTDVDWQGIDDTRHPNLGLAQEGPDLLADQRITQRSVGLYALDRVEIGPRWALMVDLRSDRIRNELADRLQAGGVDLSGLATFDKTTGRIGGSFSLGPRAGLYASWGQGFLPPATEELANNPDHLGGFNLNLVPATSRGEEVGARGNVANQLAYDVALFHLATTNDFGRYRVASRPLETFYRNAGSSRRYGVETSLGWYPLRELSVRTAYTFSDFVYTDIKSLFGDYTDKVMPNAPRHQLYLDAEYTWHSHWVVGVGTEIQSGWYVDQTNVARVDGFTLVNPRLAYQWTGRTRHGEIALSARNVFGEKYIAFTEPDPDGNSYQPGPTAEVFVGVRIWLGR